ncbi:Hypothetical protein KLENKIAIHU_4392, partial [Klenkia terrae]
VKLSAPFVHQLGLHGLPTVSTAEAWPTTPRVLGPRGADCAQSLPHDVGPRSDRCTILAHVERHRGSLACQALQYDLGGPRSAQRHRLVLARQRPLQGLHGRVHQPCHSEPRRQDPVGVGLLHSWAARSVHRTPVPTAHRPPASLPGAVGPVGTVSLGRWLPTTVPASRSRLRDSPAKRASRRSAPTTTNGAGWRARWAPSALSTERNHAVRAASPPSPLRSTRPPRPCRPARPCEDGRGSLSIGNRDTAGRRLSPRPSNRRACRSVSTSTTWRGVRCRDRTRSRVAKVGSTTARSTTSTDSDQDDEARSLTNNATASRVARPTASVTSSSNRSTSGSAATDPSSAVTRLRAAAASARSRAASSPVIRGPGTVVHSTDTAGCARSACSATTSGGVGSGRGVVCDGIGAGASVLVMTGLLEVGGISSGGQDRSGDGRHGSPTGSRRC